jgi:hypothetical protein
MPPTQIPTQAVQGPYPTLPVTPTSLDLVFTAADIANGNFFVANPVTSLPVGNIGGDVLLVWNNTAGALAFSISSQPLNGRTGDVTSYTIAANTISAFKFSSLAGWTDANGNVFISSPSASVLFAITQR